MLEAAPALFPKQYRNMFEVVERATQSKIQNSKLHIISFVNEASTVGQKTAMP